MNNKIFEYVKQQVNKIKNRELIEDTVQDVMLVLIEKGVIDNELNSELKKVIQGIIWNVSHTNFTENEYQYQQLSIDHTVSNKDVDIYPNLEYTFIDGFFSKLRKYVSKNYYSKGKKLKGWKVIYLTLLGYKNIEIANRLNIDYTAISGIQSRMKHLIKKIYLSDFGNKHLSSEIVQCDLNYKPIRVFKNALQASKELDLNYVMLNQSISGYLNSYNGFVFMLKAEYDAGIFERKYYSYYIYKDNEFFNEVKTVREIEKSIGLSNSLVKLYLNNNRPYKGFTIKKVYN